MSAARRNLLVFLAAVILVGGGTAGWFLYFQGKQRKHLDIDEVGGTILVFEVDEQQPVRDVEEKMEALARAVQRRLDRDQSHSIVVRSLHPERRIEVSIPRGRRDHENLVDQCKQLLLHTGKLEFRILANSRDDTEAAEHVEAFFQAASRPWLELLAATQERWPVPQVQAVPFDDLDGLANQVKAAHPDVPRPEIDRFLRMAYKPARQTTQLRECTRDGRPPPAPTPRKGQHFILRVEGGRAGVYTWVRLSRAEVESRGLLIPMGDASPEARTILEYVHQGKPFSQGREELLYGRTSAPPFLSKEVPHEFFVLTRLPEDGRAVTGGDLEDVRGTVDEEGQPAVGFHFTKQAGDRFHELTTMNAPTGDFRRSLSIILDEEIMSAPTLESPIRESGIIKGKFTSAQVEILIAILRSGSLPLPLKPSPVSETTVEPGKR